MSYSEEEIAVFWSKVDIRAPDDCWPWKRGKNRQGYGGHKVRGRYKRANRMALEIAKGPIPQGKLACHSCDNPGCCNPAHIFAGTPKENTQDMLRKNRFNPPIGERQGRSKLTESIVREIRAILDRKEMTQIAAAEKFGVSFSNISAIFTRRSWKHI